VGKTVFARKLGMTQIFDDEGRVVPVTVVEAIPSRVLRVKTEQTDGYRALVVAVGTRRRASKPVAGQGKALGVVPRYIREVRLREGEEPTAVGESLGVGLFQAGELVDVVGTSRGKGFASGIKRWNFSRGPMAHGSKYHRRTGSLSARMSGGGGKVFKGRKLPGHMGAARVTVQALTVVRVDPERDLLLVRGAVPGPRGGLVRISESVKRRRGAQ
jgi:large subunit ribosomal protein L3